MVSKEHPEGVSSVIMGREWTSRTAASSGSGSGSGSSGMSSQLLQDHPELLVTEVDLEEDRDREDYNSVIKAQKAKDEASNADSGIGPTTFNTTSTSNTTSATSKDRSSAVVAVKESNLAAVNTATRTTALSLAPSAEGDAGYNMSGTTNDAHSVKLLSPNKQRQINDEAKRGERGGGGGGGNENSLKITLSLPPKVDNSSSLSGESLEGSFLGNILPSSMHVEEEEEVETSGDMSMDVVHDSSVLVSALSLSSAPLSGTKLNESNIAVSTVRDVQDGMVVDEAEALRKAFEDASDSDDDDDDDENDVNNVIMTSKDTESGVTGEAGDDANNDDDDNNDDDEDGSDDDGDEEELVIEEGGGGGLIKNEETPSNEDREKEEEIEVERETSATGDEQPAINNSKAAQGKDEGGGGGGGEEEANEDDDDDDEEDWMNDV